MLFIRSSFLVLFLVYHLGHHLVKANIVGLRTKIIYQHVVVGCKQGSTAHVIDEIVEDTVGNGVAVEG